jgi:hypothetical protein
MQNKLKYVALALLALFTFQIHCPAFSLLGTGFTYQGRLNDGTGPATGTYDLVFTVYDFTNQPGDVIAGPITNSAIAVSNGLFTTTIDFGTNTLDAFNLGDRWLEIAARTNGAASFVTLTPRQRLSATPYAFAAVNASTLLGNLPASQVQGTLSPAQLPPGILTNNQAGVSLSGSFAGDGSGLTNVSATTIGGVGSNGFWQVAGNTGTTVGANFIGTTDNQPLEIRVNNTRVFRFEPASVPSLEGGYFQNSTHGFSAAAIVGGGTSGSINEIFGNYGFIGAGHGAKVGGFSAVIGGAYNDATGQFSFIGSGIINTNQADYSFVGGGTNNFIQAGTSSSAIGGGRQNTIHNFNPNPSVLPAGYDFIGGGYSNFLSGSAITIGGGIWNSATGDGATIAGGWQNVVTRLNSTIAGGFTNVCDGLSSAIGGGQQNAVSNNFATIAGGIVNFANGIDSTIGGGAANVSGGPNSTVGGGSSNRALGISSVIGGGENNNAGGENTLIAGGINNIVDGNATVVSGGSENNSSGDHGFIGGGQGNLTSGYGAVVSGGVGNHATADYSVVPGGNQNLASGPYGFAAGNRAQALHQGSFVWADSQAAVSASTGSDQFLVRARGGMGIGTASPQAQLNVNGTTRIDAANVGYSEGLTLNFPTNMPGGGYGGIHFHNTGAGGAYSSSTIKWGIFYNYAPEFGTANKGLAFVQDNANTRLFISTNGNVGINRTIPQTAMDVNGEIRWGKTNLLSINQTGSIELGDSGGSSTTPFIDFHYGVVGSQDYNVRIINDATTQLAIYASSSPTPMARFTTAGLTVNGTFVSTSDRNAKENFQPLSTREVLDKVSALPITRWNYKNDPATPHVGPMAQDFYGAFGIGPDDKHIATVDEGGVALAAIQGLNEKVETRNHRSESRIEKLEAENTELKARLEKLERLIEAKVAKAE